MQLFVVLSLLVSLLAIPNTGLRRPVLPVTPLSLDEIDNSMMTVPQWLYLNDTTLDTFCDTTNKYSLPVPPPYVSSFGHKRERDEGGNRTLLIVSAHFNRVDFLRIQYYSILRNILQPFKYIVVNAAMSGSKGERTFFGTSDWERRISLECKSLGIAEIVLTLADVNQQAANLGGIYDWILDHIVNVHNNGPVLFLDSDMFFVRPTNIDEYLYHYNVVTQLVTPTGTQVHHFWPGFLVLDKPRMPNFASMRLSTLDGDMGSAAWPYQQKYKNELRVLDCGFPGHDHKFTKEELLQYFNPVVARYAYVDEIVSDGWNEPAMLGNIYHYRSGGGWRQSDPNFHRRRSKLMSNFFIAYFLDEQQRETERARCGATNANKGTVFD